MTNAGFIKPLDTVISEKRKVTATTNPWRLKNPREPDVQVGAGIKGTTVQTEPAPEELIKVRWISATHAIRSDRHPLCGREHRSAQAL